MLPRRRGRAIGVGIQLPEAEREVRWPEYRAMARAAEAVGFDAIWIGDHLLYRDPDGTTRGPHEAWTTLAGLAEATERVAIGPLVAATAFHRPPVLAKLAATVDEISGGRLVLGLGAGWNATEFRAFGFPFDRRVARFAEAFTIISTLLRDGAIDFDGEFYQARDCVLVPRPARAGGPPILIGSNGPRMLRIAVPHAAAWNSWYTDFGNAPEGVGALRDRVDEAAREVGRDPAEIERTVAVLVRLEGGTGRTDGEPGRPPTAPISGPSEVIAEQLRAFAAEGITHVQLVVDPITVESIEALGAVLEHLDRGTPRS
jgi:probable F420-dependent oxidoreductase